MQTRTVEISEVRAATEGAAYLNTFLGQRAVVTTWEGERRVGTITHFTGHMYLCVTFDDGKTARLDSVIELVTSGQTRTGIQRWLIGAAVHAGEHKTATVERSGGTVNDRAGIIAAIVHHALCEWMNDVSETPSLDELIESANNVRDDLYSPEWIATAIASIAPDAITWPAEEMDSTGASH